MPWCSKETETTFDRYPIEGLFFLNGDVVAEVMGYHLLEGMKSAQIQFPSGLERSVWGVNFPLVDVFDALALPLHESRDEALITAQEWNETGAFSVFAVGTSQLELWDHETETIYRVTYNNQAGQIADISVDIP